MARERVRALGGHRPGDRMLDRENRPRTDVGYMTDYDPSEEYVLLQQAGLSFAQVLATLTTAPGKRLTREPGAGTVTPGSPGDLVVLDGDPARDVRALAAVRYTIRQGRIIYERDR